MISLSVTLAYVSMSITLVSKITAGTLAIGGHIVYNLGLAPGLELYAGIGGGYQVRGLASVHNAVTTGPYIGGLVGLQYNITGGLYVFAEAMYDYYLNPQPNIPNNVNYSYPRGYPTLAVGLKNYF
ncbi:MAG: hypothetical protein R2865_14210 [Deinococcales bacterium]